MVVEEIVAGIFGLISGTLGYYYVNKYIEEKRQYISTKREQLQYVYSPLEVLMKMNKTEFERYFAHGTTLEDQSYIEQHIWYPNNLEIKRIIMEKSHLLPEIPKTFLELLTHINVWLTEYNLIYNKNMKKPPVFAGTRGYEYPQKADKFVFERANNLRKELNKEIKFFRRLKIYLLQLLKKNSSSIEK